MIGAIVRQSRPGMPFLPRPRPVPTARESEPASGVRHSQRETLTSERDSHVIHGFSERYALEVSQLEREPGDDIRSCQSRVSHEKPTNRHHSPSIGSTVHLLRYELLSRQSGSPGNDRMSLGRWQRQDDAPGRASDRRDGSRLDRPTAQGPKRRADLHVATPSARHRHDLVMSRRSPGPSNSARPTPYLVPPRPPHPLRLKRRVLPLRLKWSRSSR